MEYMDLDTEIEIRFQSEQLDMLQIGYLNVHLHRIINKVAATILEEEGLLSTDSLPINANNELVLVRGITIRVENGSFVQRVRLKVASIFSRDNLKRLGRDLALNVAANLIVAGGAVAIKPESPKPPTTTPPPIERVAPDIDLIADVLKDPATFPVLVQSNDASHLVGILTAFDLL